MMKLFLTGTTTPATGKTVAVTLSKNGAAFANPNAGATNATEVSNGWYKFTNDTTDSNTIGDLVVRGTATGCDDTERVFSIVSATTGGLTNLDAAITSRMATFTLPTNFSALGINASGHVSRVVLTDTLTTYTGNTPQTGDSYARIGVAGAGLTAIGDTRIANLDATVSSRGTSTLTQTQITGGAYALNNASFAFNAALDFTTAQKAATLARVTLVDTVTTATNMITAAAVWAAGTRTLTASLDPTAAQIRAEIDSNSVGLAAIYTDTHTTIPASFGTVNSTLGIIAGYIDTEVGAIKAKTDNLPADPADASDIAASFATVNATLATISGYVDTEIASVLAAVDTEVAAIKAKTDNLPTDPADQSLIIAATDAIAASVGGLNNVSAAQVATAVLAAGDVDGFDLEETLKLCLSVLAGRVSGVGTPTLTFLAADGSKARVIATVDATGRTAVTFDAAG